MIYEIFDEIDKAFEGEVCKELLVPSKPSLRVEEVFSQ
jgi:hypothetical protein